MKAIGRALLAAAAAFLCVGAAPNWTSVVAKTEAGYRLGNPEAKVKLIAFESYTCSHCAHFEKDAGPVLKLAVLKSAVFAMVYMALYPLLGVLAWRSSRRLRLEK